MSSSFYLLNSERENIHTLLLMLEPTSLSLSLSTHTHTHTHQHTSVTHLISATKLATIFPHDPPENTLMLKLIQNNSARKSAYRHLLYQFNNFIALCLCKGNRGKKKKKDVSTPNCSWKAHSCHVILSYHPQIIINNKVPRIIFSLPLSDAFLIHYYILIITLIV